MKHPLLLALIAIVTALPLPLSAEEVVVPYLRHPSLSPDAGRIAFSYQGDIWTAPVSGGDAVRLTVHPAVDNRPLYSPDGAWIAFASQRQNNFDVFVIPASGGRARPLTFDSADDIPTGWSSNSDTVLFMSERDGRGDMFKVAVSGSEPVRLTGVFNERESEGKLSVDGRFLVFSTGSGITRWWRRDLRTYGNSDIYLLDRAQPQFTTTRLASALTHEINPVFDWQRQVVYFVANYDGQWAQIYRVPVIGSEPEALTNFADDGVQELSGTPDGSVLTFAQGGKLWSLDPVNPTPREIAVRVNGDQAQPEFERRTFDGNVEWIAVAPDGKKLAFIVHGELFTMPTEDPEDARRLTNTAAREQHPCWGIDSRTIYFASDRSGEYQVYSVDALTGVEKRVSWSGQPELKPLVSPDGKYLAFFRGNEQIIRLDLTTNQETVWVKGVFYDHPIEPTMEYDWSPDSRWLTYTLVGPTYETDVWAVNLDGTAGNLSRFTGWNHRPQFARDGKLAYFSNEARGGSSLCRVDLMPAPTEFQESRFDSLFAAKDTAKKAADKATRIDFERIETRRRKAVNLSSEISWPVLTPDGERFYFVSAPLGKSEVWSVKTEDPFELKQITSSGKAKSHLQISGDGKRLFFIEDGRIKVVTTAGDKVESLPVKAVVEVDRLATYRQKFEESWRTLRDYFYDPTFRGRDWNAIRSKYSPLLGSIRNDFDFRDLMLELMGEIDGSHMDLILVEPRVAENLRSGCLGIEWDHRAREINREFKVGRVYPRSPAAIARIRSDDIVLRIDGRLPSDSLTLEQLLAGTIGKRIALEITSSATGKTETHFVKPITQSELENLRYDDWVTSRRQLIDSLSNGKLAYLHIRSMNQSSLDKFEEELVAIAESKAGLIVDVRDNAGGWTATHILSSLQREPYLKRRFRDFVITSEDKMRNKAFERPLALVINNYSGSNAEIFAEGFRQLKLGPIIGTPTAGAVIGTSQYNLIDGMQVRRPSMGAYTVEMQDIDLAPRQPDILIENLLDDMTAGRDPQLVRAVAELLKKIR